MNIRMSDAPRDLARKAGDTVLFAFSDHQGRVVGRGTGAQAALPAGTSDTLAGRLDAAFARAAPGALVGGALAFDRAQADCLWHCRALPDAVDGGASPAAPLATPVQDWTLTAEPQPASYARAVARALEIMRHEAGTPGGLEKIVLARSLLVRGKVPIHVPELMERLGRDPSATAFRVALPPRGGQPRWLCGATPELLLRKSGARITSHPLAGSAPRRGEAAADRQTAAALEQSDKDQREHALVVESILDVLSPWCRQLGAPEGTRLTNTRSMWHLGTRIEGELKDPETSSAVLAAQLHPTPAVCGVPMARAHALIGELEPFARDFYAGAVGWCDARGNGAWHVAIRCAEICGAEARLYAGAGIVPGSDPMAEAAETGAKFGALLTALGLPADAGLDGVTRDEV